MMTRHLDPAAAHALATSGPPVTPIAREVLGARATNAVLFVPGADAGTPIRITTSERGLSTSVPAEEAPRRKRQGRR